jgi:hypothetical protein
MRVERMSVANHVQFSDSDVVNLDNWIPQGEYNPHNVRPWLLHDHGFVVAVVFADCLQNAIDEAVDEEKMGRYLVTNEDIGDYDDGWEDERLSHLGNDGALHDIETLSAIELPNPPSSFCAQFDNRPKP